MPVVIGTSNIDVPGQVTIAGAPTSPNHSLRRGDTGRFRAIVRDLDLNGAAPLDLTEISVALSTKYWPTSILLCNSTANLATAELGIYTAAGAGGTAIVTPAAVSGLSAADRVHVMTIAALTAPVTASVLYPRLTVASGVAGTCDLIMDFINLDDL